MSDPVVTLGLTAYLFGLAIGSLLLAPVSEIWGRRVSKIEMQDTVVLHVLIVSD